MNLLPILFDTSIYIPHLSGQAYAALIKRAARTGRVRLSAAVLAELSAGTRSALALTPLLEAPTLGQP